MTPPALLLLGPTASGKTAAALSLAARFPVEIISVDSALIYRGMDIGTAKPDAREQACCPHHLIDILSPEESYSAARFRTDALRLMDDISARGNIPLLTGGTMLYYKALRDGLSDLPQADEAIRRDIDAVAAQYGWPVLHAELARLDPDTAARLAPGDSQRIQRALELVRLTGVPLAEAYARHSPNDAAPPRHRLIAIALAPSDRSVLHKRIAQRFEQMLEHGLSDEVQRLRECYTLTLNNPSMRCVGYRQMWEYQDRQYDYATMREKGIAATRQLAKRQLTWQRQFKENWPELTELDCLDPHLADTLPGLVSSRLNNA